MLEFPRAIGINNRVYYDKTTKTMKTIGKRTNVTLLAAVATAMVVGCVSATVQAAEPAPKGWETTAAAGFTLTSGNSETMLATISLDSKRKWDQNEAAYGVSGGYGKNEGDRSTDFVQGYGQYNRVLSERTFAGLRLDANHDGMADLAYRVRLTPLFGYYLVKNTNTTFVVEVGPSLVTEKYEGQTPDTYVGIRFAERLDHKLSATTKVWESLEYVPQVDRWVDKYLINAEAGISTAITVKWDLRLVAQLNYDSEPLAGRRHSDLRLLAGTGYKF